MKKHTIKLLTVAITLAAILTLTGCPEPVTPDKPCTHENKKIVTETAATCTETGLEKIICADCGELIEENTIEALGHDFGEWDVTTAATCTADGEETRTCKREGCKHFETRTIKAHHSWGDWTVTKEANCTTVGEETRTCKRESCTHSETRIIEKHHTWELESNTATCLAAGVKTCKCSQCGETETVEIDALGHSYIWITTNIATKTEHGEKIHKCSRCSNIDEIEVTHNFEAGGCNICEAYKYSGTQVKVYVYTFTEEKELNDLGILCYSFEETDKTMNLNDLLHLKSEYKDYTVAYGSFNFFPDNKEDLKNLDSYSPYEHELESSNNIGIIIEPITN